MESFHLSCILLLKRTQLLLPRVFVKDILNHQAIRINFATLDQDYFIKLKGILKDQSFFLHYKIIMIMT